MFQCPFCQQVANLAASVSLVNLEISDSVDKIELPEKSNSMNQAFNRLRINTSDIKILDDESPETAREI